MPAARALSSPSGEAAEDNVEEREKSEKNYGIPKVFRETSELQ